MFPWYVQWNGVGARRIGAVNVPVAFPGTWSSKAPPSSAVTVWASPSMFMTLTVAPGLTEAGVW